MPDEKPGEVGAQPSNSGAFASAGIGLDRAASIDMAGPVVGKHFPAV